MFTHLHLSNSTCNQNQLITRHTAESGAANIIQDMKVIGDSSRPWLAYSLEENHSRHENRIENAKMKTSPMDWHWLKPSTNWQLMVSKSCSMRYMGFEPCHLTYVVNTYRNCSSSSFLRKTWLSSYHHLSFSSWRSWECCHDLSLQLDGYC